MSDETSTPAAAAHPAASRQTDETSAAPPRRSWWRRNVIGLAATLILVPATIAVTFNAEWGAYYAERSSRPIAVAAGSSAEFAGAEWQLADAERIGAESPEGRDAGLPQGTDLVVVTVSVDPRELDDEGLSPGCIVGLDELRGDSVLRSWDDSTLGAIDRSTAEDASPYCDTESTTPYRLESAFLVPHDAGDDFALQLQVADELPEYLQFELEPLPAS